jgi:hypothetical protein
MGRLHGPHISGSKRHHRDATHKPIALALEACGWKVVDTSAVGAMVPGFPDMVIGQGGITDMVQAKSGAGASFTDGEVDFAKAWTGRPILNLESVEQAPAWAIQERHNRRNASAQRALAACKREGVA